MTVSKVNHAEPACSLTRRFGAMLYDGLVLAAIWMVGTAVIVVATNRQIESGNLLFQLYLLGISLLYFHASWSRTRQTLGMRAWRIWLDPGPKPFTFFRSVLRFFAGMAGLALLGLGYFRALADKQRRTWPDLASRSRLVIRTQATSAAQK